MNARAEKRKTHWYMRAEKPTTHRNIGQSLGTQGTSDPTMLQEKMRVSDGEYDVWDLENMKFKKAKQLALGFIESGQAVYLYKRIGDDTPELWMDEDLRQAYLDKGLEPPRTKVARKSERV